VSLSCNYLGRVIPEIFCSALGLNQLNVFVVPIQHSNPMMLFGGDECRILGVISTRGKIPRLRMWGNPDYHPKHNTTTHPQQQQTYHHSVLRSIATTLDGDSRIVR
jgi:hypothetical protein